MTEITTQNAERKPHFSPVLKTASAFGKKEPRIEFGKKWKELVLPVAAFRIKLHDGGISSIKNVVVDDIPRLTMLSQFNASEHTHIFQLIDGEHITKLEAHVGNEFIHAIRFHTTMRVSLWFGFAKGEVRELSAPEGCVIRSLYGAWGRLLREVSAVFAPLETTKTRSQLQLQEVKCLDDLEASPGDYCASFGVSTYDLGAVVVSTDPAIKWIRVLSRQQVHQLMDLQNGIYPGDCEQWIDLVKGERVVKIEILDGEIEDGESTDRESEDENVVVVGLRLTTTLRTTPWIGSAPTEDCDESVYECEAGSSICGFHGARGRSGVFQLGCFVTSNVGDTAPADSETCSTQEDESYMSKVGEMAATEEEDTTEEKDDEGEEESWDVVDEPSNSEKEDAVDDVEA